jgi:phosphopantetheinyl transferase
LNLPELSISHSKAYAAATSSRRYCGIDIQYCAQTLVRVQEKFCTSLEDHILQDTLPELPSLNRLTQLWSAKEAAKKMLSPGGIPGFHELELLKLSKKTKGNNLLFFSRPGSTSPIQVVTAMFHKDYALAICCATPENEVSHA